MEYQIEDAAGYWTVPRFILQPLVENSILHGTADEDDFVTITVRATAVSYTHLDVYKRQDRVLMVGSGGIDGNAFAGGIICLLYTSRCV